MLTPTACAIRLLATPLSGQEHDPRPPRQNQPAPSWHAARTRAPPGQVTLTQNQSRSRSIRAMPLIILNTKPQNN